MSENPTEDSRETVDEAMFRNLQDSATDLQDILEKVKDKKLASWDVQNVIEAVAKLKYKVEKE